MMHLALAIGLMLGSENQQQRELWQLLSIEVPRNVGCSPQPVQTSHRWVQVNSPDAWRQRAELDAELKRRYPAGYRIRTIPVRRDQPPVVALVRGEIDCRDAAGRSRTFTTYRHEHGANQEAVQRKITADTRLKRATVQQWVDVRGEIARRSVVLENRRRVDPPAPLRREREGDLVDIAKKAVERSVTRPPREAPERSWVFHSFAFAERQGCINDPRTRASYAWVHGGSQYDEHRRQLHEEMKQSNKAAVDMRQWRVTPGKAIAIALVEHEFRCTQWNGPPKPVVSYEWMAAESREALQRRLEERMRQSNGGGSAAVVEWIDLESEMSKLNRLPPKDRYTAVGVRG